ncbi:MAG: hypothetical protein JWQ50_63 [Caballeronia mineralivorans]|jgi:hypothetical protein|nr:hypothetical protein [Caballeronia mineralivorans]MEA3101689.1 hypothetical protein [Caballeronia mineralivorans]
MMSAQDESLIAMAARLYPETVRKLEIVRRRIVPA